MKYTEAEVIEAMTKATEGLLEDPLSVAFAQQMDVIEAEAEAAANEGGAFTEYQLIVRDEDGFTAGEDVCLYPTPYGDVLCKARIWAQGTTYTDLSDGAEDIYTQRVKNREERRR